MPDSALGRTIELPILAMYILSVRNVHSSMRLRVKPAMTVTACFTPVCGLDPQSPIIPTDLN
jgi:hypothetical protein